MNACAVCKVSVEVIHYLHQYYFTHPQGDLQGLVLSTCLLIGLFKSPLNFYPGAFICTVVCTWAGPHVRPPR